MFLCGNIFSIIPFFFLETNVILLSLNLDTLTNDKNVVLLHNAEKYPMTWGNLSTVFQCQMMVTVY